MQGRDFSPLYLASSAPEWRTEYFYEHGRIGKVIPPSEALVQPGWKYMYWPEAQLEQLFDLQTDPHEEKDLARDPQHAAKLKEMAARFAELKKAAL
jgi:arylsulfatase